MKKKIQLKEQFKKLSSQVSFIGLALILGLADRGTSTLIDLLTLKERKMGMAGIIGKGLKAPSFWDYCKELKELEIKENSARTILWRLQKKGLVEKNENSYFLTKLGLNFIKNFQEKNLEKQWDGKWRIITFDIPEKMRGERNWLRSCLIDLEYKLLQKSVFIGKYPLQENFYREIIDKGLRHYIRLITVGEIDDEKILNI
jgi:hypothetical protein